MHNNEPATAAEDNLSKTIAQRMYSESDANTETADAAADPGNDAQSVTEDIADAEKPLPKNGDDSEVEDKIDKDAAEKLNKRLTDARKSLFRVNGKYKAAQRNIEEILQNVDLDQAVVDKIRGQFNIEDVDVPVKSSDEDDWDSAFKRVRTITKDKDFDKKYNAFQIAYSAMSKEEKDAVDQELSAAKDEGKEAMIVRALDLGDIFSDFAESVSKHSGILGYYESSQKKISSLKEDIASLKGKLDKFKDSTRLDKPTYLSGRSSSAGGKRDDTDHMTIAQKMYMRR